MKVVTGLSHSPRSSSNSSFNYFDTIFVFCNVYALLLTLSVILRVPREYYPQNIMFDKRIHRGNTYAAMVIPAGTSHDTMITEKRQT